MKNLIYFLLPFLIHVLPIRGFCQPFITGKYQTASEKDIEYGQAVNFSGKEQPLFLDITYPTDDIPPECGRPLLIAVHGGAFMAGAKTDGNVAGWIRDFAKKGYVAASIEYRLGMFQRPELLNCVIDNYGCLSVADTAEWHRGLYRAAQDVCGAIRYLNANKDKYNIDPNNVFLAGESAGGFICLEVAYGDDYDPGYAAAGEIEKVNKPNAAYNNGCLPQFSYPIDSMNLNRPDLGPRKGTLHLNAGEYKIRGVASFYGGIMNDLFNDVGDVDLPALYMFAQPNDLIVPINHGKVFQSFASCSVNSLGCPWILGNPFVIGNAGIVKLLKEKKNQAFTIPQYTTDFTTNSADCNLQVLFPQLAGHAIDDYGLRTTNMAKFFALKIDSDCQPNSVRHFNNDLTIKPNPANDYITVSSLEGRHATINILDISGRIVIPASRLPIDIESLIPGIYFLTVIEDGSYKVLKFVKR